MGRRSDRSFTLERNPAMKKAWIAALLAVLLAAAPLALSGCSDSDTIVLNVYNWGEYISTGEEGTYDTNAEFEDWYFETYGQKVRVNYSTYESNESLRSQLELGTANYDVIVPSDYMIDYFIQKDMLAELNFDNIPAYENISQTYRGLYYDPDNKYTVPYTYGVVGIIYDANEVDPADVTGWEVMWNSKYSGEILQFRNPRDAFGTAMYMLDIDVNTTEKADWDRAKDKIIEQAPLRKMLVMDEIFNMMEMGEAAVGAYYAGDYFTMLDNQAENVDLRFFTPERTNVFVDAMCVLKTSKHKDVAEAYINFMLMEDAAVANSLTHWYASPNTAVLNSQAYKAELGEEAYAVLYPESYDFHANYEKYAYRSLDTETLDYMTALWENVLIN
ncbi:MAG: spermidine/putrescine ABC transporter substrate-binding protein [Ruminococcaceae bacterium]|nr:spermidine/putrescine ABC transporter substrate-binding protein [Oscillospiraceae bacterium]